MIMQRLRARRADDSGSALVAAVAVAVIGIALTTLVVTQAIVVTNSTARDRTRTVEVHAAESALDATLSVLATSSPCPGPSFSPMTVGDGTDAANVSVAIRYYKGGTLLTCTAGVLSGTPDQAVVTATATPTMDMPGLDPTRVVEASVKLVPQSEAIPGAAVFSGAGISAGAGFRIIPENASIPAGVWIDSGNFTCNTSLTVDGALYVPGGSVSMQNSTCQVTGSVWAKSGYSSCCTPSSTWQVGGDLTVRQGNLTFSNPDKIRGNISVGGNITLNGHWTASTKGGTVCSNNTTACTSFVEYAPVGLPEIDLDLADWQPTADGKNFQRLYKADFATAVLQSWGLDNISPTDYGNIWKVNDVKNNPCRVPGYISTTPIQLPSKTSTTPTIYDMRDCKFEPNGQVTLALRSDIAIFANGFYSSNGLYLTSADGQPHRVWFIVPEGGTANNGTAEKTCRATSVNGTAISYCPGNIQFDSNAIQVDPLLDIFMYTPASLNFPNTATTHGQLYGGTVTVGQGGGTFYYSAIGVPGVDLGIPTSTAAGFKVEIVNKREVKP